MESVWDYPRPPRVEPERRRARVVLGGVVIAESDGALRVLETSHPPGIYLPPQDVDPAALTPARTRSTWCEWKGAAEYLDAHGGGRVARAAAWRFVQPVPAYAGLAGYVAFYPGRVDACFLGDEQVEAQASDFYGGWRTAEISGPFKGPPGTLGW